MGVDIKDATPWQLACFSAFVTAIKDPKQSRADRFDDRADPVYQRLMFELESGSLDEVHHRVLQMGSGGRWW